MTAKSSRLGHLGNVNLANIKQSCQFGTRLGQVWPNSVRFGSFLVSSLPKLAQVR